MIVDGHSHLYPRSYIELLRRRAEPPRVVEVDGEERFVFFAGEEATGGRRIDSSYWGVDEKLAYMRDVGIDRSVVSLGNPWLDPVETDEGVSAAELINAEFAALEGDTDGRLLGLGVLPQNDVDAAVDAVREIARCPTLHGVVNGARLCGLLLDDPRLDRVWSTLAAAGLPMMIHPHYGVADPGLTGGGAMLALAIGFPLETTIAVGRAVLAGVLQRHPELRLVAAHGGGTLPYLAGRLDAVWRSDPQAAQLTVSPSSELSRLHLDALVYGPGPLRAAIELVGADRMFFGTDHPFGVADPAGNLAAVREVLVDPEQVLADTAVRLFGVPPLPKGAGR